jgi:hypothetical protein
MIVELCGTDLLKLVNGEPLDIGGHIIRQSENLLSSITAMPNESIAPAPVLTGRKGSGNRSSSARSKRPRKTGIHAIKARFAGNCHSPGCPVTWEEDANIVYDYDNKKPYCMGHGTPMLPKEANA